MPPVLPQEVEDEDEDISSDDDGPELEDDGAWQH
jgi:hypothetical protein